MDANRTAPAFAQREIHIEAHQEKVWTLLSDIAHRSAWQPDIATATLRGPLARGSTFTWKSGGTSVTSTIQEVDPPRRLACGRGP